MRARASGAVVAALLASGALGACGDDAKEPAREDTSPPIFDTAEVASAIKADALKERKIRAEVTCPDDVRTAQGTKFVCKAVSSKAEASFEVTQTDDQGSFTYEAVPPFVEK